MAKVFVSHASVDRDPTEQVHRWLRDAGHEVFLDQDVHDGIAPGEDWVEHLHARLRWADAVVCIVTRAYADSAWCTAEITTALVRGSRLLPVLAEPGVRHPLLTTVQHAKLMPDPTRGREHLNEALRRIDAAGGLGWSDGRSPFPGLRAFSRDDHLAFFGRKRETLDLAARLRSPIFHAERSMLLVIGPSGCGKSSIVQAGLLPVMAADPEWLTVGPITPGLDPLGALARELTVTARSVGVEWSVAEVRRRLDGRGLSEMADELLLSTQGAQRRRLLLVVDQFEELVTQNDSEEQHRFTALLHTSLAGPISVVGTARTEFIDNLVTALEPVGRPRIEPISPLSAARLREVVEGPCALAQLELDDGLVARLLDDTGSGEALPLLAFTLAELADGVTRGGRLLLSRYNQLGGVRGALSRQAYAALEAAVAASGRGRDEVVRELLRLVTVDVRGEPTRRRVTRAHLSKQAVAELDCFVARRLLVSDTDDGEAVLSVAHEAFLREWPPLREAIAATSTALRARRGIEEAAEDWIAAGEPAEYLWERGQLAAALTDVGAQVREQDTPGVPLLQRLSLRRPRPLVTERIELSSDALRFLSESRRHDRRRRRRSTTVLTVLLVGALVAAIGAGYQWRVAQIERDNALHSQVVSEAARLGSADLAVAAQLEVLAHRMRPTHEVDTALISMGNTPLPTELAGHGGNVQGTALSPDGRLLATASQDRTVRLWNVTDRSRPRAIEPPLEAPDEAYKVAFSPDGRLLVAGGDRASLRFWDVSDPAAPVAIDPPVDQASSFVFALAFRPDGRVLAVGTSDGDVQLWAIEGSTTPTPIGPPVRVHDGMIGALAFDPTGRILASASDDSTARLWRMSDDGELQPASPPLFGHGEYFTRSLAISPDSRTLATGGGDRLIRLWDISDPDRTAPIGEPLTGHTDFVMALAFTQDGQTLASGSGDNTVRLWTVTDPSQPSLLSGPLPTRYTVLSVAFSPDGRTLAAAGNGQEPLLWDIPATSPIGPIGDVQMYSHGVAVSPDGRIIATGVSGGGIQLWDAMDPAWPDLFGPLLSGHRAEVVAVAFSPDRRLLASGSNDGTVRLWDVTDPARAVAFGDPLAADQERVWSLAISPDGRTLAAGDVNGSIHLWDIGSPARPKLRGELLAAHENSVNSIAFSPDGLAMATAGGDNTIRLWDVSDPARPVPGAVGRHDLHVNAVAWSPDARTLASGSGDTTVRLWDVSDRTQLTPIGPRLNHTDPVFALAFSPDGRMLASGAADNAIRLWDVGDPAAAVMRGQPVTGHTDAISGLAFGPDGHSLVTTSRDQTLRFWDLDVQRSIDRICTTTAGALTPEVWNRYVSPDLPYSAPCPARSQR